MTVSLAVSRNRRPEGYRYMLTDKAVKAAKPVPGNRYRKLADQGGLYLFARTMGHAPGAMTIALPASAKLSH
jgi:hypothetical protein